MMKFHTSFVILNSDFLIRKFEIESDKKRPLKSTALHSISYTKRILAHIRGDSYNMYN